MKELPFVRCVGFGTAVFQRIRKKAYDYRMICILCGDGIVEIDSRQYKTSKNQIYIINPGTEYRVCSEKNQKITVINFDTTYKFSHIKDPVLSVDTNMFENRFIISTENIKFLTDTVYEISYTDLDLFEEMYGIYLREDLDIELKNFMLSSKLAYILSKALDNKKILTHWRLWYINI